MALTTGTADWSRVTARYGDRSPTAPVTDAHRDADEAPGDLVPSRVDSALRWRLLRPAGL